MLAYVYPNMERIFEFNNLRFSPEVFNHLSVIKDDCCVVVYGCFFFAWTSSREWRGKPKVSLFTADAETNLVWMRFQISFSPLTNLSIQMLNFTELMAADDYLNSGLLADAHTSEAHAHRQPRQLCANTKLSSPLLFWAWMNKFRQNYIKMHVLC